MKKMREILFSEKGMKIVNLLFFLSLIFYRADYCSLLILYGLLISHFVLSTQTQTEAG